MGELNVFEAEKIKKATAKKLGRVYFSEGLDALYDKIQSVYEECGSKRYDVEVRNQIKGECTEIYLQAVLREAQKWYPGKSCSVKGLCITKSGTDKTTELDVSFFCEHRVYLFECKCYAGVKTLTDIGFLESKIPHTQYKREIDVYRQSKMHADYLNSRIGQFHKGKVQVGHAPYKLVMVDGSAGTLVDKREEKYKEQFPVVALDDLKEWIETELKEVSMLPKQWDMIALETELRDLYRKSDVMLKKHLTGGGIRNV